MEGDVVPEQPVVPRLPVLLLLVGAEASRTRDAAAEETRREREEGAAGTAGWVRGVLLSTTEYCGVLRSTREHYGLQRNTIEYYGILRITTEYY